MVTDHRTALAKIKRFDQLIAYLRDEMGWPISRDSFEDVNDLFYDFTAEELGIDPKTAAKIESIKRLRPLSPKQPWGIFFVKFEPKNLPVVALRRILGQVALKKRPSANSAERAAWAADDLLFISNYGEGDKRQITFAHFSKAADGEDLPTLKVLGWDNLDTALHLDAVAKELTQHLSWPEDDTNAQAWRQSWRAAFNLRHHEVVATSRDLSIRLAELARGIRDRIKAALAIENEAGALTKLMKAFQETLVHDLDADSFADMYAQTIAYGLLSARIADPSKKTADDFAAHMHTNPFLRELMETFLKIGGRRGKAGGPGIDFDELGVSDVVQLLDDANMEAVVRDFGDRNPQEDPVIHFYELFLKEYDAESRMERGVFYTPRPVVSYIVRAVDELLRTEFNLADGLADTTSWGEMAKRHGNLTIPEGVLAEQDFIQILDPATGTGTFLVEATDLIYKTMAAKWRALGHANSKIEALWNDYVPRHLLPRLHGYELLMAPYAIAHLKIGLKLHETGYHFVSNERARIYLTNALEPAHDFSNTLAFAIPALAHESQAVNDIKSHGYFTVVIGNPPYARHSSNPSKDANGKTTFIGRLIDEYKEGCPELKKPAQAKYLQDDYVKFVRFTENAIVKAGYGVFGLITNHGYLDNPTFRGMRNHLLTRLSIADVLDLHGNANKKERSPDGSEDKNVFDIKQGVAIFVGARLPDAKTCTVRHGDLWGSRDSKYQTLANSMRYEVVNAVLTPKPPQFSLRPRDETNESEYLTFVSVRDIFSPNGDPAPGIVTTQDSFAVAFSSKEIVANVETLLSTRNEKEAREHFRLCTQDQWSYQNAKRELKDGAWRGKVIPLHYRPFDVRYTVYDSNVAVHRRERVTRHLLDGSNLALLTSRMTKGETFKHVQVTRLVPEVICMSPMTSNNGFVFPLWLKAEVSNKDVQGALFGDGRRLNLGREFLMKLCSTLSMSPNELGVPNGLSPEEIFYYIFALLHSPSYRTRYAEFLKNDFPRLPLTGSIELCRSLARLGGQLVSTQLLEAPKVDHLTTTFIGPKDPEVARVGWSNETVWLDAVAAKKGQSTVSGSIGFHGVSEAVWNFHIGGYQVCEKWLKARRGRTLSKDDILHYQKMVVAVSETISLMGKVDQIVDAHGGWPGAFARGDATSDGAAGSIVVPVHPKSAAAIYQVASTRLLYAAEHELPPYETAALAEVDTIRTNPDELDREDLVCRIRQLFADGQERERGTAIDALARELGYQRTGPRIHEELDNALRTAARRGVLASERGTVSLFARTIDQYDRDFLKDQFLASLPGRQWLEREDAVRAFARWMGFRRTGPTIEDTARSLINGLLRESRLESAGTQLRRSG
jgi:type I restriction-modification system DNA methylase subunit